MLLYPPIKDLLGQVPSRYMLVNLVASRARKLSSQAEKEERPLEEKAVSLAIREVADGTLTVESAEAEAGAEAGAGTPGEEPAGEGGDGEPAE